MDGHSGPTVIVPNCLYLRPGFRRLARDHRLVFYDMRNRGRSAKVIEPSKLTRGIHHDVADLEAVRRHIGESGIRLIGHSYLGLMVLLYATRYGHHVDRIVQLGPMQLDLSVTYPEHLTAPDAQSVPDPEKMRDLASLERSGYAESHPREYCRQWWEVVRVAYVTDPEDAEKVPSGIEEFPNEWPDNQLRHLSENILPSIRELRISRAEIEKCSMPVLTIHGAKDRAVPYGAARDWVSTLPDARLVTVANGGHMPWIEEPETVFPAIQEFFRGRWPSRAKRAPWADRGDSET